MRFNKYINYNDICEKYTYDSISGFLFNKYGQQVGSVHTYGYRRLKVQGKWYPVHRLIWLLVNKVWPDGVIDHINGNRDDNRLINLRCVSIQENNLNSTKVRMKLSNIYKNKKETKSTVEVKVPDVKVKRDIIDIRTPKLKVPTLEPWY